MSIFLSIKCSECDRPLDSIIANNNEAQAVGMLIIKPCVKCFSETKKEREIFRRLLAEAVKQGNIKLEDA
jgi:S-adenosylmethionine/arginine decarboxylase-like enzyme